MVKKIIIPLLFTVFMATNTSAQWTTTGSNIYYNSGNAGIGTTSPKGSFHVAGDLVTSASGGTVRKFSTSVSSTQLGSFKIGELIHSGNYQNLLITGKIYGQSGGNFGEISFSVITRSHILPNKTVKFQQTHITGGRLLELKVYEDENSGRVVVGFVSSGTLQSFGWDITIIERGNYGYWENENSYVELDSTGLTKVSQGANRLAFMPGGNIGIGTTTPDEKLTVAGTGKFKEVIVVENAGADFVFEGDHILPDLFELEAYLKANKHLPEIPPAKDMIRNGVKVGELQMKLLQKIEELTLYIIEQQRTIDRGREKGEKLREELAKEKEVNKYQQKLIDELLNRMEKLENRN